MHIHTFPGCIIARKTVNKWAWQAVQFRCRFFGQSKMTASCHIIRLKFNKKASIRLQDSARHQFQAGHRGDVGL